MFFETLRVPPLEDVDFEQAVKIVEANIDKGARYVIDLLKSCYGVKSSVNSSDVMRTMYGWIDFYHMIIEFTNIERLNEEQIRKYIWKHDDNLMSTDDAIAIGVIK